jgi:hypothetical protein
MVDAVSEEATPGASPAATSTESPEAQRLSLSPSSEATASPAAQQDATNPCLYPGSQDSDGSGTEFLTVESRCREDTFNVAILGTQWLHCV